LSKLILSGGESDSKPVTIATDMTEANFGGAAKLGLSGAIILAAWLEHKVPS
jgi:hypothetical protein